MDALTSNAMHQRFLAIFAVHFTYADCIGLDVASVLARMYQGYLDCIAPSVR